MTTCPKCHRPSMRSSDPESFKVHAALVCMYPDGASCQVGEAAYRRGLLAGVELAKREVVLDQGNGWGAGGATIDWSDVDTEAAKMAGEG